VPRQRAANSSQALVSGFLMALWLATLLPQFHRLATATWEQLSQRGSPNVDIVGILGFAALVLQAPGWFAAWLFFGRTGRGGVGSLSLVAGLLVLLVNAAAYLPATLRFTGRVQKGSTAKSTRLLKLASRAVAVLFLAVSIALAIYFWRGGGDLGDSLGRDWVGLSIASLVTGAAATRSCFTVTRLPDGG